MYRFFQFWSIWIYLKTKLIFSMNSLMIKLTAYINTQITNIKAFTGEVEGGWKCPYSVDMSTLYHGAHMHLGLICLPSGWKEVEEKRRKRAGCSIPLNSSLPILVILPPFWGQLDAWIIFDPLGSRWTEICLINNDTFWRNITFLTHL